MSENIPKLKNNILKDSSNSSEMKSQSLIEINGNTITSEKINELEENMILNSSCSILNSVFEPSMDDGNNTIQENCDNSGEFNDEISSKKKYIIYFIYSF